MLAYQLMLTVERGLPLSRLLRKQKTDARSSKAELQSKESAPAPLKVKEEVVIKKEEKLEEVEVKEEREEVDCPRERVSSSESSILRWGTHNLEPIPHPPTSLKFSLFSPPSASLHPTLFPPFPNSTVLPDACCKLGVLWGLSMLGPSHPNIGRPVAEL